MKTIVIYCQDLSDIKELIFKILQRYSNKIIYAVPHISRRPVNNEIHGVHGHFITNDAINKLIQQEYFIEYSQSSTITHGTSLETIEKIHHLNRLCLMTVCENGLKMLKSKHFPAKYIHYFTPPTPPPPQKVEDSSTVTEPSTESSENKEGATSSVQEIKIEQLENLNSHISFNLTINSNDPAALDILHNELIHWFPDELLE